ncbi:hypothetical protein K7432_010302 [Basidiobolus ranarum]|uniref:Uncharacterized protein n=1 Tax=Basidiobolus ranarum TaxID=34480 RepID=A0ABR2VVN6_9FUNG
MFSILGSHSTPYYPPEAAFFGKVSPKSIYTLLFDQEIAKYNTHIDYLADLFEAKEELTLLEERASYSVEIKEKIELLSKRVSERTKQVKAYAEADTNPLSYPSYEKYRKSEEGRRQFASFNTRKQESWLKTLLRLSFKKYQSNTEEEVMGLGFIDDEVEDTYDPEAPQSDLMREWRARSINVIPQSLPKKSCFRNGKVGFYRVRFSEKLEFFDAFPKDEYERQVPNAGYRTLGYHKTMADKQMIAYKTSGEMLLHPLSIYSIGLASHDPETMKSLKIKMQTRVRLLNESSTEEIEYEVKEERRE